MSQPSTGVAFKSSGLAYMDALRIRRGGDWAIIVRDYNGSETNISPGSDFGSPMALDGTFRDDLFAIVKSNGRWIYNNAQPNNQRFYPLGYVLPEGIERTPKISSDPLEVLQSVDPARYDMQTRQKTVMFTPIENNPVVHCLQYDLPLTRVLDLGSGTYFKGENSDVNQMRRQIIVLHEDRQGDKVERNAFPIPKCVITDAGAMKGNKKDADAPKLTFAREIDSWFVDVDGTPLIDGRWCSGTLWDEGLTPGLTFTQTAPVADATGATTANVGFEDPLGGSGSNEYTVEKSPDGVGTWTAATVGSTSPDTPSAGLVRLGLTGLTTATTYFFRVTVTDSDSDTSLSLVSNSITTA